MMPWWTVYITWLFVIALNIFLSCVIMWLGLDMGIDKNMEWILTFLLGLLISIFLFMPAKVVLIACFAVWVTRRKVPLSDKPPLKSLDAGLRLLAKEYTALRDPDTKKKPAVREVPLPMSFADAKKVRDQLRIEEEARRILRDLVLYTIFTIVVVAMIFGHLDVTSQYKQMSIIKNQMLGIDMEEVDSEDHTVKAIHDVHGLWDYLINVAVPRLVPREADPHGDTSKPFMLISHVRLRQVRTTLEDNYCYERIPGFLWPVRGENDCSHAMWFYGPEEGRNFKDKWTEKDKRSADAIPDTPFRYSSSKELMTVSFIGQHGLYSGGGYVVHFLREDPGAMQNYLRGLASSDWIDHLSRCVFLEFTVYNPSADMYTQVILSFELDRFGGVFPQENINTASLTSKDRENKRWLQFAESVAALCLIFNALTSINQLVRYGRTFFFQDFWNWIEVAVFLMSALCVALYMARDAAYKDIIEKFNTYGPEYFVDFTTVFIWQRGFHYAMGFLGALVIFKMLKVTTFNPFMKTFTKTLSIGLEDFGAFVIFTGVVMFAFASLGRLVFGSNTTSYASLNRSLLTLTFFILGEADYPVIVEINETAARFFFLGFMFVSQYIVINLFIAILRDSLELTRFMSFSREKAVIQYMVDTAMLYLDLTGLIRHEEGRVKD